MSRSTQNHWRDPDPRGLVDLHIHTTASDGSDSPRRLFEMALKKGLKAIGFCDHDSIASVSEGFLLAEEFGIEFVPGCEIGIAHDPDRGLVETDLVAYFYDPHHDEFNDVLTRLRKAKNNKLDAQLKVLAKAGYKLIKDDVRRVAKGETIRRPHIFAVMKDCYPEMQPNLFYTNTDFGGPWYVSKDYNLSLEECVAVVRRAGGITVLSSPGSYNTLFKRNKTLIDPDVVHLVELCSQAGVGALETIYTYHRNKPYFQTMSNTITGDQLGTLIRHYEDLAARLGMVKTGGSDYHGSSKPQIRLGELPVPYRYFENLKRAVGRV
ncbi:MAG: PHP domain-containing protein [Candidatus Eisenbacteria sp.]|nr:PHP domain-containing protein [Candidatus Eisenbacteria bacterium]